MKIAFFSDTFFPQRNGVVTAIWNTTKQFSKNHQVFLFVPGKKIFRCENKSKNITIIRIPSMEFSQYDGYRISKLKLKKIGEIFEKEKFDMIHIHSPFTLGITGIIMARLYFIPIVGTYHTYLPEYFPHIVKGRFPSFVKRIGEYPSKKFTKFIYSKLDTTIAPSREIGRILRGYGIKKVVIIPNGIKFENFKFNKKLIVKIKRKYKIPNDKKIILYLGRISFEKKLDILLKAFKLIEKKYENVLLLIVGSGPYLKKYKKQAKELKIKNIIFTGFVPDEYISSFYFISDIFVSPSDTETQGLTFIEAINCNLPLVGVNKGGVRDIIQNGKNGFLAKPKNPISLASKIKILLDKKNLVKKMKKNNKKFIKKYSITNTTKNLLNLYMKIKSGKKKQHPLIKIINLFLHTEVTKDKITKKFIGTNNLK